MTLGRGIPVVFVCFLGCLVAHVCRQRLGLYAIRPSAGGIVTVSGFRITLLGRGIRCRIPFVKEQAAPVVLVVYVIAVFELMTRYLAEAVINELFMGKDRALVVLVIDAGYA